MPSLDSKHAVYVGSFDPPTLGHSDIIERGARIFNRLTVGIGVNPEKTPLFTPDEREVMIREIVQPLANVEVTCFHGLAVEFVQSQNAGVMLRGVRTLTDIDAEFTMSLANHVLAAEIETVFLMSGEQFTHISSSLIKQIAQLGGPSSREHLKEFVPEPVIERLLNRLI